MAVKHEWFFVFDVKQYLVALAFIINKIYLKNSNNFYFEI